MPLLQLIITVKLDGKEVQGYPLNLVYPVQEFQQFDYLKAPDELTTTFTPVPLGEQNQTSVFGLQVTDQLTLLRMEGNTTGSGAIVLNPRGGCMLWGALLTTTALQVNNPNAVPARLLGFGGGA